MANGFVTDYSFLNLPEIGSAVRGPIELPSFEPVPYITDLQAQIAALQDTTAETPSVISEQPETPLDSYLRDQERIDAAVSMMPGADAIQTGIEELIGRITAGGGKLEDFVIYQPPTEITPAPAPSAPPLDNKLYAGVGQIFNPSQIINSKIPLEFFNNTIYSPSTKPVNSFLPIQRASFAKGGVVEILRSKRNKKER